jgi:hypothetical protein
MRKRSILPRALLLPGALVVLAACEHSPAALPAGGNVSPHLVSGEFAAAPAYPAASGGLLREVRRETARFNSTTLAVSAGYVADTHCVAVPGLGGMGYHWANFDLIDPVFDPLQPEVVLYAPGGDGNLRLAAVEYIVIDVGQSHPDFDGHPFDVGGVPPLMAAGIPHWSLHVWVHLENPNGVFVPFNPRVSCG